MAIARGMSAWGDIQSFGGKRLRDGESAPIGSNRGGARIRVGGRFMDSLGRPPAKLSCLSGFGPGEAAEPRRESIFRGSGRCADFPRKFRESELPPGSFLLFLLAFRGKRCRERSDSSIGKSILVNPNPSQDIASSGCLS